MNSEVDLCCICWEEYNLQDHKPVRLQECSHSLGKKCLEILLKQNNLKCPQCKESFPPNPKTDLVNQELRKETERREKFEICTTHNKPLELYCLVDQDKICIECLTRDRHNGHTTKGIVEDIEPELTEKIERYKAFENKVQIYNGEAREFLRKKTLEEREQFIIEEKLHKKFLLEKSLRIETIIENHMQDVFDSNSNMLQQIKGKEQRLRDLKHANLKDLLAENPEEVCKTFRNEYPVSEQSFLEIETKINQSIISSNQTTSEVSLLPTLYLNSYLSFDFNEDLLEVSATNILNPYTKIEISEWSAKIKRLKLRFFEFDFNEKDIKILKLVLYNLEDIHSISLKYENISDNFQTIFEEHLVDFPRIIFSALQKFQSIGLSFINTKGSDRIIRFLTENLASNLSNLNTLKILCESTDLQEQTLINFIKKTDSTLASLTIFSFTLKNLTVPLTKLSELALTLPNLEDFSFVNICADSSISVPISFIEKSLEYFKKLRSCKIQISSSDIVHLKKVISALHSTQKTLLTIEMPNLKVEIAKIAEMLLQRGLPERLIVNGIQIDENMLRKELSRNISNQHNNFGLFGGLSQGSQSTFGNPGLFSSLRENIPQRPPTGLFSSLSQNIPQSSPASLFGNIPQRSQVTSIADFLRIHSNLNDQR